jgi:DNA-binding NarL/FixJ family response regulator
VILDLVMPKMGGKETFIRMREVNPDIVALIASGYSDAGDVREIIAAGARGFIQKPFVPQELVDSLFRAMAPRSPVPK